MTNIPELTSIDLWMIVKWFYVAGFGLYLLFSLIVWRQIQLMSKTLNGTLYIPIKLIGTGLVVTAGIVLILSVMVL